MQGGYLFVLEMAFQCLPDDILAEAHEHHGDFCAGGGIGGRQALAGSALQDPLAHGPAERRGWRSRRSHGDR